MMSEVVLQHILLKYVKEGAEPLFFRLPDSHTGMTMPISLQAGEELSLDTYFNCFSIGKYLKYTSLNSLNLCFQFQGSMKLNIYALDSHSSRRISETELSSEEKTWRSQPIDLSSLNHSPELLLYCIISAESDCIISSVEWRGNYQTSSEIHLGLCICTYKREEYLYRNVSRLSALFPLLNNVDVLIADNGHSVERKKINDPHIHLFDNPNKGGSGGFARCMLEAERDGSYTHLLLMDDDIILEPETVYRTDLFLKGLRQEYRNLCLSGSMFTFEKPCVMVESGSFWNGKTNPRKENLDVSVRKNLVSAGTTEEINYGAWWYFVFPMSFVKNQGLPMPFFIRGDDIEFSLRNHARIITMNGICVWHESFDKKTSDYMEYYLARNNIIVDLLHLDKKAFRKAVMIEKLLFLRSLMRIQYDKAEFRIRGLQEVIKGPCIFLDCYSEEEINDSLREKDHLLAEKKRIELSGDQRAEILEIRKEKTSPVKNCFFALMILLRYLFPMHSEKDKPYIIDETDESLRPFLKHGNVVFFNPNGGNAIHAVRNRKTFWSLWRTYSEEINNLMKRSAYLKNAYREQEAYLSSSTYWEQHLQINDGSSETASDQEIETGDKI